MPDKKSYKHVWTLDTSNGEATCKYCRVMRNLDGSNDERFCLNSYPWERK